MRIAVFLPFLVLVTLGVASGTVQIDETTSGGKSIQFTPNPSYFDIGNIHIIEKPHDNGSLPKYPRTVS